MRTIGMPGGTSRESTAEYYRLANRLVAKRLGGLHSADLVIRSVDFADVEDMQACGAWPEAADLLADAAAGRGGRRRPAAALHQHDAQGGGRPLRVEV